MARTDDWLWIARYEDGEQQEFDADGVEHGWAEVDAARVVAIELVPTRDGLVPLTVATPDGASPYVFRRRTTAVSLDEAEAGPTKTVMVVGWDGCFLALHTEHPIG